MNAIILGVSAGTGAALARALAKDPGLDIVGFHRGRKPEQAAALEDELRALGRTPHFRVSDAGKPAVIPAAVAALRDELGPGSVRVLVHSIANASLGPLAIGEALEPWQYQKSFDAMAHSFAWWCRELHRQGLLAPSARLLALGNPITDSLADNLGVIAAAKAALEIYVRVLARELGPLGHRVNLLKFGLVDTRASQVAFSPEDWPLVRDLAGACTPAGRLCTVEEVGRLASFLVGPDAEWFNGATLDFTGGMVQGLLNLVHAPRGPLR